MFWNQTHNTTIGDYVGANTYERPTRKHIRDNRAIKLEKVQPLVARFLALKPEAMRQHFAPATQQHLHQIICIRQDIIKQSEWEDKAYLQWRYKFVTDPEVDPLDENRLWVFTKGDEILGFVGVESADLIVDDKPMKVLKVMDLAVKPEVDRRGLGVWMNLHLQGMGRPIIALGSNPNSIGIMSKLFHRMPGQIVYKNILNSNHYFFTRIDNTLLAGVISSLYNLCVPMIIGARILRTRSQIEVKALHRFLPNHDPALAQMQYHGIRFKRDSRYLNWRLFDTPRDKVQVIGVWQRDRLVGYLALAFRTSTAVTGTIKQVFILDWGRLPGSDYESALVTALLRCQKTLRKQGVESISAFGYDSASDCLLRQAGLYRRDDDTKTVSIFAPSDAVRQNLIHASQWFLTGADTDYA